MIKTIRNTIGLSSWAKTFPRKEHSALWLLKDYIPFMMNRSLQPEEYCNFEFDRQSPEFRESFLCRDERRYYLDLLNPILYHVCSRNKFVTHKMFEDTGIPSSKLYCHYQPEGKVASTVGIIADSVDSVTEILKKQNVKSCVIKVTDSSHGDGVVVVRDIEYIEGDTLLHQFDGSVVKLSDILSDRPLIFESLISQSEQMASFNSSSVNTIRVMTALYPDGNVNVFAAFIKIGRQGKCVDNAGSGGNVDAGVDIDTGTIYNVCQFDGWGSVRKIEKHPDSQAQLNGCVIENWEEIKAVAIKAQKAYPYCRVAGWDVAVTKGGPVIIEVNDLWDATGQLFTDFGWRDSVRDCYKAWKKSGKKVKYRTPIRLKPSVIKYISKGL